jgi:hypothetical protein
MGLKFFGKSDAPVLAFGASMLAIVGEAASPEQVDAANQELDAAGIKGAQLVPGAVLDELTAKASRPGRRRGRRPHRPGRRARCV